MNIIKATVENFKRVEVVEIDANGQAVEVTGANEQGKSSVLDAIEAALGGKRAAPAEPIRRGEKRARVVLDLGEVKVERVWTESSDRLVVTTAEGARYSSPQAWLDERLAGLAFDPVRFVELPAAEQRETLLRALGVDLDGYDRDRQALYDQRTEINREARALLARAEAIQEPAADTPDEPVSVQELMAELTRRQAAREEWARAQRHAVNCATQEELATEAVATAERELAEARKALTEAKKQHKAAAEQVAKLTEPDLEEIRQQIASAEWTNDAVRAKRARAELLAEVETTQAKAAKLTASMAEIDDAKRAALDAAEMPVDGLTIDDGGLRWDGLPLEQAAMSRRIRVAVAILAALRPKIGVALVRQGNDLDDETLREFYQACEAAGVQPWVERRSGVREDAVVIEAGRLAGGAA